MSRRQARSIREVGPMNLNCQRIGQRKTSPYKRRPTKRCWPHRRCSMTSTSERPICWKKRPLLSPLGSRQAHLPDPIVQRIEEEEEQAGGTSINTRISLMEFSAPPTPAPPIQQADAHEHKDPSIIMALSAVWWALRLRSVLRITG